MTNLARYQHIGQEIHFDGLVSDTTASLAASSGYIERETLAQLQEAVDTASAEYYEEDA